MRDPRARPDCFPVEDWREWLRAAHTERPGVLDFACIDCTPEFKARMMAAGKCSWPCVQFFPDPDDASGVVGRRMSLRSARSVFKLKVVE